MFDETIKSDPVNIDDNMTEEQINATNFFNAFLNMVGAQQPSNTTESSEKTVKEDTRTIQEKIYDELKLLSDKIDNLDKRFNDTDLRLSIIEDKLDRVKRDTSRIC